MENNDSELEDFAKKWLEEQKIFRELRAKLKELNHDKCEFCLGIKGGAPGNENVIDGVVVCDYCTSILLSMKKNEKTS